MKIFKNWLVIAFITLLLSVPRLAHAYGVSAALAVSPQVCALPCNVTLTATGQVVPAAMPYTLTFHFGDGSPDQAIPGLTASASAQTVVTHQYGSPLNYQPTVTITDAFGDTYTTTPTASTTIAVTVNGPPPPNLIISWTAPAFSGPSPFSVPFTIYPSEAGYPSGNPFPYNLNVDFGDGVSVPFNAVLAQAINITHAYFTSGTYCPTITMQLSDGSGGPYTYVTPSNQCIVVNPGAVHASLAMYSDQPSVCATAIWPYLCSLPSQPENVHFYSVAQGGTPPYLYYFKSGDSNQTWQTDGVWRAGAASFTFTYANEYAGPMFPLVSVHDSAGNIFTSSPVGEIPIVVPDNSATQAVPVTVNWTTTDLGNNAVPNIVNAQIAGAPGSITLYGEISGETDPFTCVWSDGQGNLQVQSNQTGGQCKATVSLPIYDGTSDAAWFPSLTVYDSAGNVSSSWPLLEQLVLAVPTSYNGIGGQIGGGKVSRYGAASPIGAGLTWDFTLFGEPWIGYSAGTATGWLNLAYLTSNTTVLQINASTGMGALIEPAKGNRKDVHNGMSMWSPDVLTGDTLSGWVGDVWFFAPYYPDNVYAPVMTTTKGTANAALVAQGVPGITSTCQFVGANGTIFNVFNEGCQGDPNPANANTSVFPWPAAGDGVTLNQEVEVSTPYSTVQFGHVNRIDAFAEYQENSLVATSTVNPPTTFFTLLNRNTNKYANYYSITGSLLGKTETLQLCPTDAGAPAWTVGGFDFGGADCNGIIGPLLPLEPAGGSAAGFYTLGIAIVEGKNVPNCNPALVTYGDEIQDEYNTVFQGLLKAALIKKGGLKPSIYVSGSCVQEGTTTGGSWPHLASAAASLARVTPDSSMDMLIQALADGQPGVHQKGAGNDFLVAQRRDTGMPKQRDSRSPEFKQILALQDVKGKVLIKGKNPVGAQIVDLVRKDARVLRIFVGITSLDNRDALNGVAYSLAYSCKDMSNCPTAAEVAGPVKAAFPKLLPLVTALDDRGLDRDQLAPQYVDIAK